MTNTSISPGNYLQLQMEIFSITKNRLCNTLDCSKEYLNQLLHNNTPITKEIARGLSILTYTKSDYWLKIQSDWDTIKNMPKWDWITKTVNPDHLGDNNMQNWTNISHKMPIRASKGIYLAKPNGVIFGIFPTGLIYKTKYTMDTLGTVICIRRSTYCINAREQKTRQYIRVPEGNILQTILKY
jgi:plasmid maintenance system antidote protein VapI